MKPQFYTNNNPLRIAIQKSGRLSKDTIDLLNKCGIDSPQKTDRLLFKSKSYNCELMFVRDDDIPRYVEEGICELGIVGENVLLEKSSNTKTETLRKLGFSKCKLSIATPRDSNITKLSDLEGLRIATSYPNILQKYLFQQKVQAQIMYLSGSVEIAPSLGMADCICDLVSTGNTLRNNDLEEKFVLLNSQAILISNGNLKSISKEKQLIISELLSRIDSVQRAGGSKYIMMNAPVESVEKIRLLLPGLEEPTIVPLVKTNRVAIHAVAKEEDFWQTIEKLKAVDATSILVTSIEKVFA